MAIAATMVTFSYSLRAAANPPDTAPAALTQLLTSIDQAANGHALDQLLNFYSPNFSHADGLDKDAFKTHLSKLWQDYPRLTYETELLSWEQDGDRLIAETKTTIKGVEKKDGRWSHLQSEIHAKQTFVAQQMISQEILSESSELTSGDNPPAVRVLIPKTVAPKESFGFDVIVKDPLENDILLGGAIEENISTNSYATPEAFELDILPAGGIFKRVEAPAETGDLWYSAMIIRSDGMTLVSHRVKVQEGSN